MRTTVAITGGNGFIAKSFIKELSTLPQIRIISLQRDLVEIDGVELIYLDLNDVNALEIDNLYGIDVIIHAAALVHKGNLSEIQFKRNNFEATRKLFSLARDAGVKKFIFLSTVGVYGLNSSSEVLDKFSSTNPKTPYAQFKLAAEQFLLTQKSPEIHVSILRLPLVYGPRAPGNIKRIMTMARMLRLLPFGSLHNKRSMLSIQVLVSVLVKASLDVSKFNGLHVLVDKEPISTLQLATVLVNEENISVRFMPVPLWFLKMLLVGLGQRQIYEQVCEDLVFDGSINSEEM